MYVLNDLGGLAGHVCSWTWSSSLSLFPACAARTSGEGMDVLIYLEYFLCVKCFIPCWQESSGNCSQHVEICLSGYNHNLDEPSCLELQWWISKLKTQISDSLILPNNLGFESWLWCGHQFHFSRGNSSCTQTVYFQSIEFKIKTCRNLCHIFKTKFCQTWHWEQPMIQTPPSLPSLHQKAPFLHSWQKDSSARA